MSRNVFRSHSIHTEGAKDCQFSVVVVSKNMNISVNTVRFSFFSLF